MNVARLCVLVVTTGVLSGCAETHRVTTAVADSAGVEIFANLPEGLESAEPWSLSTEPVIEIGAGATPDVPLFGVTAVTPLGGGRVAVGTITPPQVMLFEPGGTLALALGRAGQGPGEFLGVGSVVPLPADSVAVWDPDRRRLSVFTVDGHYAREVDLSATAPPSIRSAPTADMASGITRVLPSTDSSLVLFGEGVVSADPEAGINRPKLPAYRITLDGKELAIFGAFPGMEWFQSPTAGFLPLPFGARTYAATSNGALVVGTAESTELHVFGPTGALVRIVRWPDGDRTVGGSFLAAWSDMVGEAPPEIRELVEALPRRERFPAYEGLVATDNGEVLVGDYTGPLGIWPTRRADHGPEAFQPQLRVPARRWLAFDLEGALVATVSTPEGFEPYAVREGLMWGVYTDELDVESVRAYEMTGR